MGISGHMLGDKKLRQLSARSGLDLERAYRRGHSCQGLVRDEALGSCRHYSIDWDSGMWDEHLEPMHWSSCRIWFAEHEAYAEKALREMRDGLAARNALLAEAALLSDLREGLRQ